MNQINGFLQKFIKIDKDNVLRINLILSIIKNRTKIDLPKSAIQISQNNIKINCSSLFKNEIFLHKEEIEEDLKENKIFLNIFN